MSRYTYVGDFTNPAKSYFVKYVDDQYQIWVKDQERCDCGCPNCRSVIEKERPSNPLRAFDDVDEAHEYIEGVEQFFEEDYESYREENAYAIRQQELYEQWRNEY